MIEAQADFEGLLHDIYSSSATLAEDTIDAAGEAMVDVLQAADSQWPEDTGESKLGFYYRPSETNSIVITNTKNYARYVNNNPTYPKGAENPNFQAVERTLIRGKDRIYAAIGADQ